MKTKALFFFLILFTFSLGVNAQISAKKFQVKMGEMGTFSLEFKETTYELTTQTGDVRVAGTYKIEKNTILFTDTEGPMACPAEDVGKYKFSFENKVLKMELIEDSCTGRHNMAITPWNEIDD